MNHIPFHHVAARHPAVVIENFVAFYVDMLKFRRELTIQIGSRSLNHLVVFEAFGCFLHHSESLRQDVVQGLFNLVKNMFLKFVDLLVNAVFLLQIHVGIVLDIRLQLSYFRLILSYMVLNIFLEFHSLVTKAVDIQILDFLVSLKCFLQKRLQRLIVARRFISKKSR